MRHQSMAYTATQVTEKCIMSSTDGGHTSSTTRDQERLSCLHKALNGYKWGDFKIRLLNI